MNVVSNARDALQGPGEVRITLSRHEVSANQSPPRKGIAPGRWIRVDVDDTGMGMAPEVLARAFQPFFTTKSPGQGTGVGLSRVQRLVTEHGGDIAIESHPGEGTTATIWLPEAGTARLISREWFPSSSG